MKLITAFEAEDGMQFSTEDECVKHETKDKFGYWYAGHARGTRFSDTTEIYRWLQNNAEAIRGFLPPVSAKHELDISVLREYASIDDWGASTVPMEYVKKWLAGELK